MYHKLTGGKTARHTMSTMNWQTQAVAWLRGKAAEQAQSNERWPEHAKCYPSWTQYVKTVQRLADELEYNECGSTGMQVTRIKVSELKKAALNFAVAKCEGRSIVSYIGRAVWVIGQNEQGCEIRGFDHVYSPSADWAVSGPIVEREGISITSNATDSWHANYQRLKEYSQYNMWATNPLTAAMRCYVASKLGEEVDIPEKLL